MTNEKTKINWWNKVIKPLFKLFFLILFMLMVAGFAQLSQVLKSNKDIKTHLISEWIDKKPLHQEIYDSYKMCIDNKKSIKSERDFKNAIEKPRTVKPIYECADKIGSDEFKRVLIEADSIIKTIAWPLIYLDDANK